MTLRRLVAPWSGDLLRHRPKGSKRSVLDETFLGETDTNRWSARGVRAYYFAHDRGIIAAEYARHIRADLPTGHAAMLEREVFRIAARLERMLDLTDPRVAAEMGAEPINTWILDIGKTQAAASYLMSQVGGLQGIIVPSAAFLDDHGRFNVVVFRDAIDPRDAFSRPVLVMNMVLKASGA